MPAMNFDLLILQVGFSEWAENHEQYFHQSDFVGAHEMDTKHEDAEEEERRQQ